MDNPDNTQKSGVKRDEKGRWMKGTATPNPTGRPPLGESWREIFDAAGKLTKSELMKRYPIFGKRLEGLPQDVPLRDAVALSALVTLACEPSPGLLAAIMERTDGKVPTQIEIRDWRKAMQEAGMNPDEVLSDFEQVIASKMGAGANGSGGDATSGADNGVEAEPSHATPATGEIH